MFEDNLDLLAQAIRNVGKTFGGRSKILLDAIAKEITRLKRVQEQQEHLERMKRLKDDIKARKVLGLKSDDDIPF